MPNDSRPFVRVVAGITALGLATCVAAQPAPQATPPAVPPVADTGTRGIIIVQPTVAAAEPAPQPAPVPVVAPAPPVTAPPKACPRPFDHPDIRLTGSDSFPAALRRHLLRKRGPVVVDLVHPSPVGNSLPPELAPWLKQVKAAGGTVTVDSYCAQSRGLFGMLRGLFGAGAADTYAVADGYDVVLHVDGVAGAVTQVEFKPRAGS
jgi:hypothetical protein